MTQEMVQVIQLADEVARSADRCSSSSNSTRPDEVALGHLALPPYT